MPIKGRKFVTEFLIPNLNEKKFGPRLMWLNISEGVFQLQWNHKAAAGWTKTDAGVFIEWDKKKGHYKPHDKEYYSKSKQRFRAVLYKLIREKQITKVCTKDKYTMIYCLGDKSKEELEMLKNLIFIHPEKYIVQNANDSIIEDHRYSQCEEQVVSDYEDDMLFFHVNNNNLSLYSPPRNSETTVKMEIDAGSYLDSAETAGLDSAETAASEFVPTTHVNVIVVPTSYTSNSFNEKDWVLDYAVTADSTGYELAASEDNRALNNYHSYDSVARYPDTLFDANWDLFKETETFCDYNRL